MSYFGEIVPEFDRERVYPSDIKKVFNWYNLLQKHGLVDLVIEAAEKEEIAEVAGEKEAE